MHSSTSLTWFLVALAVGVCVPLSASAPGLKIDAYLLWGTNGATPPPGKNYKPVNAELRKKLKDLPLKWSTYFEVHHRNFTVPIGEIKEESMSTKCQIKVKNIDNDSIEVTLIGRGKEVMKRKQSFPHGEILALGGNAPNSTAWLVVLKRAD